MDQQDGKITSPRAGRKCTRILFTNLELSTRRRAPRNVPLRELIFLSTPLSRLGPQYGEMMDWWNPHSYWDNFRMDSYNYSPVSDATRTNPEHKWQAQVKIYVVEKRGFNAGRNLVYGNTIRDSHTCWVSNLQYVYQAPNPTEYPTEYPTELRVGLVSRNKWREAYHWTVPRQPWTIFFG